MEKKKSWSLGTPLFSKQLLRFAPNLSQHVCAFCSKLSCMNLQASWFGIGGAEGVRVFKLGIILRRKLLP